jgi:aspartate aminotransferase
VVKVVACGKEQNFKLTGELLRQALTEKTKVLILNSPSNPTGEVYTKKELEDIATVLKDFPRVVVLSDDIYNRLVFDGKIAPHLLEAAPELKDRTIVINGISKSYAMTGWRLGWAAGPQEVISAMNRYQSQSVSCACSITQEAALFALENSDEDIAQSLVKLKGRRDLVYKGLNELPDVKVSQPQGAFYFWPDVSAHFGKTYEDKVIENSEDFSQALLKDQGVAATAGVHFGLEGYLRISYALSEERMQEAIERIAKFIHQLKV